jgi:hypothetical protein
MCFSFPEVQALVFVSSAVGLMNPARYVMPRLVRNRSIIGHEFRPLPSIDEVLGVCWRGSH